MRKEIRWPEILRAGALAVAVGAGVWLLWPVVLPFLLGLLAARAAEPGVRFLDRRLGLPRWLGALGAVAGVYGLLGLGGWLLCRVVLRELGRFLRSLPVLAETMTGPMLRLKQQLLNLAGRFPDGVGAALEQGVQEFFSSGAGLGQRLYDWAFSAASRLLGCLPELGLFLLTALLSGFMISAKLPQLENLWQAKAPRRWETLGRAARETLGAWLAAQGKLLAVTFCLVTAGLMLLRMDYALLFGLGIAALDALPALGTGTILIPWSLGQFLQGDTVRGVGLLLIYGAAALTRAALEPRLLGRQMGLDPLVTLAALYAGFRFFGVWGMIFFPMGALLGKQLWDVFAVDK